MLKMHKGISNISKDIDKNCSTKKYITFIYVAINFIFDFFKNIILLSSPIFKNNFNYN